VLLLLLQATAVLQPTYWLGHAWDEANQIWGWSDGDDAANGEVLNSYPYAHW
jgi:hypothetical protein